MGYEGMFSKFVRLSDFFKEKSVATAAEAFDILEEVPDIHMILTQLVLQDMSAAEFIERLHEERPSLPVIGFCTQLSFLMP